MTRTARGNRRGTRAATNGRSTGTIAAGVFAFVPLVALFALTIGTNTPIGPRLPLQSISAPIETAAYAGPAFAALILGFGARNDRTRVAMLVGGVFGGLTLLDPAASMPARIALGAAAILVVSRALPSSFRAAPLRSAVMLLFGAGIVVSMIGSVGIEPALARQVGSVAMAGGLLGLPTLTGYSTRAVAVGVVGAIIVAAIGLSAPVMTAAISLLGMGVVGLPLPLLVLGALGAGTAISDAIDAGQFPNALAAGIVLVAGVPSSIPGAVAVLVALALFETGGSQ